MVRRAWCQVRGPPNSSGEWIGRLCQTESPGGEIRGTVVEINSDSTAPRGISSEISTGCLHSPGEDPAPPPSPTPGGAQRSSLSALADCRVAGEARLARASASAAVSQEPQPRRHPSTRSLQQSLPPTPSTPPPSGSLGSFHAFCAPRGSGSRAFRSQTLAAAIARTPMACGCPGPPRELLTLGGDLMHLEHCPGKGDKPEA